MTYAHVLDKVLPDTTTAELIECAHFGREVD